MLLRQILSQTLLIIYSTLYKLDSVPSVLTYNVWDRLQDRHSIIGVNTYTYVATKGYNTACNRLYILIRLISWMFFTMQIKICQTTILKSRNWLQWIDKIIFLFKSTFAMCVLFNYMYVFFQLRMYVLCIKKRRIFYTCPKQIGINKLWLKFKRLHSKLFENRSNCYRDNGHKV